MHAACIGVRWATACITGVDTLHFTAMKLEVSWCTAQNYAVDEHVSSRRILQNVYFIYRKNRVFQMSVLMEILGLSKIRNADMENVEEKTFVFQS